MQSTNNLTYKFSHLNILLPSPRYFLGVGAISFSCEFTELIAALGARRRRDMVKGAGRREKWMGLGGEGLLSGLRMCRLEGARGLG